LNDVSGSIKNWANPPSTGYFVYGLFEEFLTSCARYNLSEERQNIDSWANKRVNDAVGCVEKIVTG